MFFTQLLLSLSALVCQPVSQVFQLSVAVSVVLAQCILQVFLMLLEDLLHFRVLQVTLTMEIKTTIIIML